MKTKKIIIAGLAALILTTCRKAPEKELPFVDTNVYPPVVISEVFKETKQLGIYYGWPSYVNGANGDVVSAAESFKDLDYLVLEG